MSSDWKTMAAELERLAKRRRIHLSGVLDFIDNYGGIGTHEGETRAVVALVRQLLSDPKMQRLLAAISTLQLLEDGTRLLSDAHKRQEIKPGATRMEFWDETRKMKEQLLAEVRSLQGELSPTLVLVRHLVGALGQLGYDEDFDLPEPGAVFPPLT